MLKTDIKRGLFSLKFLVSVVLLLLIGRIGASGTISEIKEYMKFLHFSENSSQGGWMVLQGLVGSKLYLTVIPLCSPLAFGDGFYEEFQSRFVLMSLSRGSFRKYMWTKVFTTLLAGGLCVCISLLALLPICVYEVFPDNLQFWKQMAGIGADIPLVLQGMGLCILSGCFWALISGISVSVMKSRAMAYTTPFILFYILSEFQSRYYTELYWFSPMEWVRSGHLTFAWKYGIFMVLLAAAAFGYILVMKERLKHV